MRYILLLFISGLSLSLFAQIDKPIKKGNVLLGGYVGAGYSTSKSDQSDSNDKYYYLSFSPGMGYFLIDNLAVGLSLPLSYDLSEYSNYTSETFRIGLGSYLKYYSDKGIFLGLEISLLGSFNDNEFGSEFSSSTYKYLVYEINPCIGYAIFMNQKVSLETSLNYQYQRMVSDVSSIKTKYNRLFINIGFQIFL
jgi:hypothetical protein